MLKFVSSFAGKVVLAILLVVLAWTAYYWLRHKSAVERLSKARPWVDRIYSFWPGARKRIRTNLSLLRPDLAGAELEEYSRRVAHLVGVNSAYLVGSQYETVADVGRRVRVGPRLVALAEKSKRGQPAVIALGHTVPFDGALGIADYLDIVVSIVVESMPAFVRPIFTRNRDCWRNINLIPIKRGQTYKRIDARLKEGHIAIVLVDLFRDPSKKDAVVVRIGNALVGVPTMPASLARNNQVPLYVLETNWDPATQRIFLEAVEFPVQYSSDAEADIQETTIRLGAWMGEQIQARPWDWMRSLWQSDLEEVA